MKIAAASDIHGSSVALSYVAAKAREKKVDLILLAGDITCNSMTRHFIMLLPEMADYAKCPIVLVPGNHDYWRHNKEFVWSIEQTGKVNGYWQMPMTNRYPVICLIENEYEFPIAESGYKVGELKIWGSPYTHKFGDWVWQRDKQDVKFDFPDDTDILLTHECPFGYGDFSPNGARVGCEELAARVKASPHLKLHVFGHAHCGGWMGKINDTLLVNAAMANEDLSINYNGLQVIELP